MPRREASHADRLPRRRTRFALAALICTGVVVVTGAPAAADPAGPTHYRSTITAVEGDGADAVSLEVLGGDAFIVLRVQPGTTVEVPGYDGEPYVRIGPDGVVEVNERSPARWLNDARYGAADLEIPAAADADAPPLWSLAGRDGVYAWHEHRIHWMSPALPSHVDPDLSAVQPVMDWELPLVVDGEPVTVHGELVWVPGPGPAFPLTVVAAVVLLVVGSTLRWPVMAPVAAVVASFASLAVALPANTGLPTGAEGEPALVVLPLLALAVTGAGWHRWRRAEGASGPGLTAAAGVPLLVWGIAQAGALTRPLVPGPVGVGAVRLVVAFALAAGLAVVLVGLRTLLAQRSDAA